MITQETIALAATIWDEAKDLDLAYRTGQASTLHARDLATHSTRCQTLYLKLCEEGTPGYQLHDVRVASATGAFYQVEVVEECDSTSTRAP